MTTTRETTTRETTNHSVETEQTTVAYYVTGPLPTADGRPPLVLIGQPMTSEGFVTLGGFFPDRTVVTYDPRGGGNTVRKDGRTEVDPVDQAADVHAVIEAIGGPVDLFGTSGGAITGLALVANYPDDVRVFVAHEPPLLTALPDADLATEAFRKVTEVYQAKGWGHGMGAFIALTQIGGELTQPFDVDALPDPAMFGLPNQDDGKRSDPLLSGVATPVTDYRLDVDALQAAPTRVVIAGGIESKPTITWRTSEATAAALGAEFAVFPSHHAGFLGGEFGQAGQPEEFAAKLREYVDA